MARHCKQCWEAQGFRADYGGEESASFARANAALANMKGTCDGCGKENVEVA